MLLPWDELNELRTKIEATEETVTNENGLPVKRYNKSKCLDIIYDYLVYAYDMGVDNVNENMSTSYAPQDYEMRAVINEKVAGKDYVERVTEWAEKGKIDAILRVAETDAHRVLNAASYATAKKAKAKYKTWVTMQDDKVRDSHDYLLAMTIPIDDYFVTYNGDKALVPGQFGVPEEDVNCRCILTYA